MSAIKITYHTTGGAMLEFEAENEKKAVEALGFWQNLPENCPKCQKPLRFFHRSPQGNDYYGLVCAGTPSHETNFGQFRNGGGFYYKNEWQNAYSGVIGDRDREINDPSLAEPQAELNRLRSEIEKLYGETPRTQTLEGAIRERYGVSFDKLQISQLREILDKMQNPEKAKTK